MDEVGGGDGDGGGRYWWWTAASTAQMTLGIISYRRGHSIDSLMPLKAFVVASLFVGATASAAVAGLRYSGIYSVEDMKEVGASIRTGLGVPPRAQDK